MTDTLIADAAQPASPAQADYADAAAYERYMGRWSRQLAKRFLDVTRIGPATQILDIGSGTGALSDAVVGAVGDAETVGIDPTPSFVAHAQAHARDARQSFMDGDARCLPFPDDFFDASLALLSLHNIPDADRALNEMCRVTRPGGVLAACEWDFADGMQMFRVVWDVLFALHPEARAEFSTEIPLGGRGELHALWTAGGIRDVVETSITLPMTFSDFDDFWTPFAEGPSRAWRFLNRLSDAELDGFQRTLRRTLLGDEVDGPFRLHARAWAVRGYAP